MADPVVTEFSITAWELTAREAFSADPLIDAMAKTLLQHGKERAAAFGGQPWRLPSLVDRTAPDYDGIRGAWISEANP